MSELPINSKKYYPDGNEGANVTFSYWYEPPEKEIFERKGGIGLLISLMGPDDFSGERAAKFMWDSYREEYLDSTANPSEAVRSGVKSAQLRLMELIKNESGVSEQGVDLHMCAFVLHDGKMYISLTGNPSVALLREGDIVSLSDMLPSYEGAGYKDDVSVGAFDLARGDMLLFSSPQLVESFLDIFDEKGIADISMNWSRCAKELELYSENMVGNQYLWLLGYGTGNGTEETLSVDAEKEMGDKKQEEEESEGEGSERRQVDGETLGENKDEETPASKPPYTPRGIWGGMKQKWQDDVAPKIKGVKVRDQLRMIPQKARDIADAEKRKEFTAKAKRSLGAAVSKMKLRDTPRRPLFADGRPAGVTRIFQSRVFVLVVFILIVSLIGFYFWRQRQEERRFEAINESLAEIAADIEDAADSWDVNQNSSEAEEMLTKASEDLDSLENQDLSGEQADELEELRNEIQAVYDTMNRVAPLSEDVGTIEILTDLYLKIGEEADIKDLEKFGRALFFVDAATHAVYRYTPGEDIIEKVGNSEDVLKSPQRIAIGESFMFVYDSEVGIVTMDMTENEPDWSFRIRPELSAKTLGNVTEIAAFSDNVYILKTDEARVLKSFPAGSGYSYPEEYFRHGGLDKAIDILIDGNIYVLSDSSDKVYKFFGGKQDPFTLSGLTLPLGNLCCGTTNLTDSSKLYVFDGENNRLVSIEKPRPDKHPGVGVMVMQYEYRGDRDDIFNDVREIVVDMDERLVYVLDGTRILKVLLEHD